MQTNRIIEVSQRDFTTKLRDLLQMKFPEVEHRNKPFKYYLNVYFSKINEIKSNLLK